MRKRSKKLLSLLLAAGMTLSLAACGDDTQTNDQANNLASKQGVYRMEQLTDPTQDLGFELNPNGMAVVDDKLYILSVIHRYDEYRGIQGHLVSMNTDGSDLQAVELFNNLVKADYGDDEWEDEIPETEDAIEPRDETEEVDTEGEEPAVEGEEYSGQSDVYVSASMISDTGVYLTLETSRYRYDEYGNYMSDGNTLELYAYNLDGTLKYTTTLSDNMDENYLWFSYLLSDDQGNLYMSNDSQLFVYDAEGNQKAVVDMPTDQYVSAGFRNRNGGINFVMYNNEWTKISLGIFDTNTLTMGETVELPGNLNNYSFSGSLNYDMLLSNSNVVYGFNIGDAEPTLIMDYVNSDINGSQIGTMYELADGSFVTGTYELIDEEEYTYGYVISKLTPVAPEDVPDKQTITLGCYYLDYEMRNRIIEFNKANELYRISVKDYSTYSTMEDYSAGYSQLNNDILSGQMPDIMDANDYYMDIDNYVDKGLLADIGQMIDDDPDMDREDFMTNVFDAYSYDGKLYSVIPNFYVQTVMAKTSLVGEEPGWTMEDLKALMEQYPEASVFGESMVQSDVLWQCMMYSGSRFVNRETGECSFNTQEFIDMLEFIATFPAEYDYENSDYYTNYESQWREGRTLLFATNISYLEDLNRTTVGYFGEPVTMIGFPCEEGIGAVVRANTQYVISAKSSCKEGAWEFLRYYLTEEYQSDFYNYNIPILRSAVLEQLDRAKERPFYEDENGDIQYYDNTFWTNNEEIVIPPLTDEEATKYYDYLSSVTQSYYYNEGLYNILMEESEAFFAGQKTAQETADIIQSRASIYISESR